MVTVYIGFDAREEIGFEVCVKSLLKHASIDVDIKPLREWELRQSGLFTRPYRIDDHGQMWDERDGRPFSTQFSFTRFLCPVLYDGDDDWFVFTDCDFMWRDDIAKLMSLVEDDKSIMCVKHHHVPSERIKMDDKIQSRYRRKNWSSLMIFHKNCNRGLTLQEVNHETGSWLHSMSWLTEDFIGEIPLEWNWLEGYSSTDVEPKVVHFTRGTPDFPGYEDVAYADEFWSYLPQVARCVNG